MSRRPANADSDPPIIEERMAWVLTRMQLDREHTEWLRHGLSAIALGFGSFAFLQGVISGASEPERFTSPSRVFSIVSTLVGMLLIALACRHNLQMTRLINRAEFRSREAPELPDERRPYYLSIGALVIGTCSLIGLILLQ